MSFPMDEITPGALGTRPDAPEMGPAMLGDIVQVRNSLQNPARTLSHGCALIGITLRCMPQIIACRYKVDGSRACHHQEVCK